MFEILFRTSEQGKSRSGRVLKMVSERTTGSNIANLINQPAEEIDVEEDVFAIVEIQLMSLDHDLAHRVRGGT